MQQYVRRAVCNRMFDGMVLIFDVLYLSDLYLSELRQAMK